MAGVGRPVERVAVRFDRNIKAPQVNWGAFILVLQSSAYFKKRDQEILKSFLQILDLFRILIFIFLYIPDSYLEPIFFFCEEFLEELLSSEIRVV